MKKFFSAEELVKLYDSATSEKELNQLFERKTYSCFWPDGQLHNEGPAPLIKFIDGASTDETILPNPFFIRKENLHWLSFAGLCKKHFHVSGTCLNPSKIQITPALYDAGCDILLKGQVTLIP